MNPAGPAAEEYVDMESGMVGPEEQYAEIPSEMKRQITEPALVPLTVYVCCN